MYSIRKIVATLCLLLCVGAIHAQSKKATTWPEAIVELRANLEQGKYEGVAPLYSSIIKIGQAAQVITYPLTGVDELTISIGDAGNGNDWDQAVLGNPTLIDLEGNRVSLLDVVPTSAYGANNTPRYNQDYNYKEVTVGKKSFEASIFVHSVGELKYDLGGKYKQLEVEIGMEDDSRSNGSVVFAFQDSRITADKLLATLDCEISKQIYDFVYRSKIPVDDFLFKVNNPDMEKSIVERLLKTASTVNKEYYKAKADEYATLPAEKQSMAYMLLADEILTLNELNEKLAWVNLDAMALYLEDMKSNSAFDYQANVALYKEIAGSLSQVKEKIAAGDTSYIEQAKAILALRDKVIFANPLLDDDIIISRFEIGGNARKIMAPDLGTQSNNWSNQESARRVGYNSQIAVLSNLRNGATLRTIYAPENGSPISDLRMHWDGERAMFTGIQEDGRWNLYQADLKNGGAEKILEIPEEDIEFYDGTYLPDGRIIAISNIGYQGVPCVSGSDPVGNMVLYDPADKSYRRITFDQDANWNPSITNDGKVIYTRWEYTDLTHYYSRIVMTMNPDGTEQRALYGSGYMFPNSVFDMQVLPGHSSAFVGIISGHHGIARSGRLILFDPKKSRKGAAGMLQEIPYRDREIEEVVKDRLVDGVWPQFIKPTPIDDKYYLVSGKLSPEGLWGVYLVDVYDNVTCIYEAEGEGVISPAMVRTVATPPAIPDKVNLAKKEATVFIQDIYEGEGLQDVPRGTIKELRILSYEYAYLKTKSDHNWHGIQSGWDIKRLLGTVPVEEDGSAIFTIPANTPIAIQPVGYDGAAVQWMRSWFTGMPGEVVSCIGCHEDLNQIAMPKRVAASTMQPHKIEAPEGGVRSFTFDLEIQPILDRACIACHNGQKTFDLSDNSKDQYGYGKSYLNFHPYIHRQGGEGDQTVLNPYEYHPNTSELVRILKRGHYNVELTDKEWRTLYNWIDFNAPDKGYFDANVLEMLPYQGHCQIERRTELTNKYGNGMGVDWKQELADYAAYLESQGEIEAVMPKPTKQSKVKEVKAKNWPFDTVDDEPEQMTIELSEGVAMKFVRIPAGQFIMGSNMGAGDARPASKVSIDNSFWMGELEVTNEQFNIFFPDHSSRYMDEQWKDHVDPGYPAFLPELPVIRISWQEAMAFCEALSEKSGLKVTLPTEAQWEWACRAGTDTDFWYGNLNSDFGKKENMADITTNLFAVAGLDPRPMDTRNPMYKHYTFLPKDTSVDDGNLIQVEGGGYEANPFGLYDMHGNVAEWTRSDYLPYPYGKSKGESQHKVVRGGSAYERPKMSTSHSRKGYYPHQGVYNVGFRVIIEE